jgi:hypothetical protein
MKYGLTKIERKVYFGATVLSQYDCFFNAGLIHHDQPLTKPYQTRTYRAGE